MKMKTIGKTGVIPVMALLLLVGCVPTDEVVEEATINETTAVQAVEIQTWQPWADVPLNDDVQEYLHKMCEDNNLAYSFIIALIETESNFNSDSVSGTDDYGLLQINACNHKEGFDYLDPYDNITMGIEMLSDLAEKYGDVESVLMAYNLGEAGAKKLWSQGIYSTDYTKKVLERKIKYEEEHGGDL
jgi:soluble lytic murein transglycosylase-like protein